MLDPTAASLEADLLRELPDVAPDVLKLHDWWGDEQPGINILVGDVMAENVRKLIVLDDAERLRAWFWFFEKMARSSDIEVRNALAVSLLESLGDSKPTLAYARAYMGPKTLEMSKQMERALGRE